MSTKRLRFSTQPPISASIDSPESSPSTVVVCCPPDPALGGNRSDVRLRRIGSALAAHGIAAVRFDYRESTEPTSDLSAVLDVIRDGSIEMLAGVDQIHLFGYSYGGGVAIQTASSDDRITKIALMAPVESLRLDSILPALTAIDRPLLIILGEHDRITHPDSISNNAPAHADINWIDADHSFLSHMEDVERLVIDFFRPDR